MTALDSKKNKFYSLAIKCFDKENLENIQLKDIYFKKDNGCYYAVFSCSKIISHIEELKIAANCARVFKDYAKVIFYFDYSGLGLEEKKFYAYINEKLCIKSQALKPFLVSAHSYIKGNQYHIDFKSKYAKDMFIRLNAQNYLQEILQFNFNIHYPIALGINIENDNNNQIDLNIIEPFIIDHEEKKATKGTKISKKVMSKETKQNTNSVKKKKQKEVIEVIMGNGIKRKPIMIADISDETHKVCIEGEVIDAEDKTCKNGSKLVIINITDYTSTIQAKMFMNETLYKQRFDKLKSGHFKIEGEISYDFRQKAFSIKPINISKINKPIKEDIAEEKRVELHLHTVMSAEDATIKIKGLIDRACEYGHKAVAITDHGVVQAFPIAEGYSEKKGIDIIYGMEAYMILDKAEIYNGTSDIPFDGTFVVADLETTGLSASSNAMIEIGAVKIKDGKVVDQISTFVDPQVFIPHKITQITGITQEMVKGAPKEDVAIKMFKDFVGNDCIVAHNASFDMSFFRCAGVRNEISFRDNPVLDTLSLSQCLLKDIKRHNLKAVANYFNIPLNHHRALNDAIATSEALLCLFSKMKALGIDSTMQINLGLAKNIANKNEKSYHVILLCKNKIGLKNLYKIVSHSHIHGFYRRPRISKEFIKQHREGLIIGSACEQGEVYRSVLNNYDQKTIKDIVSFYDYLEIQPLGNNEFLIREGLVKDFKELEDINRKIVEIGKKYGKTTVATCDAHFLDPKDSIYREVLMTVKNFSDAHMQPPLYFRTTDEMLDEFKYLGEEIAYEVVVENTNKIYKSIEKFELLPKKISMPKIKDADKMLWDIARKTAHELYGNPLPENVESRLNKEMNAICKHGFAVLYYIAHLLIANSMENGFIVGSRGSVGSSFAAFMTSITEVNPLPAHYRCANCKHSDFDVDHKKYDCGVDLPNQDCPKCGKPYIKDGFDIPFETFLGLNADKVPDIDLNFSGEYQSKAHEFTVDYFGKDHVFRAGTISTIAEKTAVGYVKNYLEQNNLSRPYAEIKRIASGIIGVKRTTGQHPGGLVVLPKDQQVYDYTPIQKPANDMKTDLITTHFDFDSLHDRLVKLDILGHDDPTMLKKLSDLTGIDAKNVPLRDEETMKLFSSIDSLKINDEKLLDTDVGTYGIPEFGTKFVRGVLTLTKPSTMSELVRISGLSHGADVWQGNADILIKEGKVTLSDVISTRDDIMNAMVAYGIDHKLSFFTMEHVRKGKGLQPDMEQAMIEHQMPAWFIESCKKISYMFPKAHAVAYVTMALRIAYYKVHYPKEYYATYFSIRAKNFDATYVFEGMEVIKSHILEINKKIKDFTATTNEVSMVTNLELAYEMYQRGIGFLPVDIEKSEAKDFVVEENGLRMPFSSLPGVGENAAVSLKNEALNKKYVSRQDIINRAKVSKTIIQTMDEFGCLMGLTNKNQISIFDEL